MVDLTGGRRGTDDSPQARLRAMMRQSDRGEDHRTGPALDAHPVVERTVWRNMAERWLPESWLRSTVDPGRAGLLGLLLAALVILGVVAGTVWSTRPAAVVPEPPMRPPLLAAATPSPSAQPVVVSVVGKVARPGLVEVKPGARVADALAAAGGPLPDTDIGALNLARKLTDGEQLHVGVPVPPGAESGAAATSVPAGGAAGDSRIDLNNADAEQLDQLPGIGRVTAERILRWRAQHGRFTSVEQLREVGGIGETRLARLRDLVRA